MTSRAATVDEYLAELPEERRLALSAVRTVMLENLPAGVEEGMAYGLIGYSVPHSIYPPGYHCNPKQPLPFAGLASQKNHMAVYLFCVYCANAARDKFIADYIATGKKLDMGAGCVRFKRLEDFPLEVLASTLRSIRLPEFIRVYEAALPAGRRPKKPSTAI